MEQEKTESCNSYVIQRKIEEQTKQKILKNLKYLNDRERSSWLKEAPVWDKENHRFYKDNKEILERITKRKEVSKCQKATRKKQ